MTNGQVIEPAGRLSGELRVPGDKSISHRALLISAVGEGKCRIEGLSDSLDVGATRSVLASLGVQIISNSQSPVEAPQLSTRGSDWEILVEGRGWSGLQPPSDVLNCGNSGTTARSLIGVVAGRPFETSLDGDKSLKRRPMLRVVEPLRAMGAGIDGGEDGRYLPLRVRGGDLDGIEHRSPVASAQIKTCLMLAGMQASGETAIEEPGASRDHSERMLEYLGVSIVRSPNRVVVKSTNIQNASSLSVPGDLSSAAFLLVGAAILPGSEVTVHDVGLNPTRTGILEVLERFGARVETSEVREVCGEPRGTVTVRAGDRRPVSIGGADIVRTVDELPLVAVLGAYAEGETVLADAAELRVKESDRIATMASGLRAMGAQIDTTPDGLVVRGIGGLRGAAVEAAGDHRIAMALAIAGLGAEGPTQVSGWESVAISYPGFLSAVEDLL
ncbi:MAG: 3-phosphoshikimate 1-carboxyvinyltransferase [Actinomycetota bacterium]